MHACTEEEFSLFYEVRDSDKVFDAIYRPFYQCIDYSKVKMQGNTLAQRYQRVTIDFIIPESECRNEKYDIQCVTSEEYEARWGA